MALRYTPYKYPTVESLMHKVQPIVDAEIQKLRLIDAMITAPKVCADLNVILAKLQEIMDGKEYKLTLFELQTISYHCADLSEELLTFFLCKYLFTDWNKFAIKGLMHSILLHWGTPLVNKIIPVLLEHIDDMSDVQLAAFDYFKTKESPIELGKILQKKNVEISQSPRYVLLQDAMFTYPYFQPVIRAYFGKTKITLSLIDKMLDTIVKHKRSQLAKLLLPDTVIRAKSAIGIGEDIKTKLIAACISTIGEPDDISKWGGDNLSEEDNVRLQQCRAIIRTWRISRVIELVFTTAGGGEYKDRAPFWKTFAGALIEMNGDNTQFLRVYTNNSIPGITPEDWKQFSRKYSGWRISSKTAILMRFGDWTIVEMLDGGCAYFYKKGDPTTQNMYDKVWSYTIYDSEDLVLRDGSHEFLQEDIDYRLDSLPEGGRIAHRGKWKTYFKKFIFQRQIIPYDVRKDIGLKY